MLEGYDEAIRQFLREGFTKGFHINFEGKRVAVTSPNLKSANERPEWVEEKINKELRENRLSGPFEKPPSKNFRCSPIGLQPKKDGTFRLIQHLSWPHGSSVNDGIPVEFSSVQYDTVAQAIQKIKGMGGACYMAKTDIKSAFRIVPIHPSDQHLLGFKWQGKYYFDRCLPMGCSASCNIFEKLSTALQWAAQQRMHDVEMLHVLDDFLFISSKKERCLEALHSFLALCEVVGVPIAKEKTEGPHQVLTFLGIELDSIKMEARLPVDKLDKGRSLIAEFKGRSKVSLKEIQSLTGFLNFTTSVILPGKPFLRRLINLSKGLKKSFYKVRLTRPVREDLALWEEFLQDYNGASFFIEEEWVSADKLHLFTDAAKALGYGLIFGSKWIYGEWDQEALDLSISVLEMYPIALAFLIFSHNFKGRSIIIHTDNEALVHVFQNKSSRDALILSMYRRVILTCLKYNIRIKAVHIPGKINIHADALSRLQISRFKDMAPWADSDPTSVPQHLLPENLLKI